MYKVECLVKFLWDSTKQCLKLSRKNHSNDFWRDTCRGFAEKYMRNLSSILQKVIEELFRSVGGILAKWIGSILIQKLGRDILDRIYRKFSEKITRKKIFRNALKDRVKSWRNSWRNNWRETLEEFLGVLKGFWDKFMAFLVKFLKISWSTRIELKNFFKKIILRTSFENILQKCLVELT